MNKILHTASALLLAACAALAAAVLVPGFLGYERYVITGVSMTGTIDKGSLLFSKQIPVAALDRGDVITFTPAGQSKPVTHRIIWTGSGQRGERLFRTKGDANAVADPGRFSLDQATQARAAFHLPYAGYALAALSMRQVRVAVIGLPAAMIALFLLTGFWREIGREADRRSREAAHAA